MRVFAVMKSYVEALKLSKVISWVPNGYMLSIEFTPISAIDKIYNIAPDILIIQNGILHITVRDFVEAALNANPQIVIIMAGYGKKDVSLKEEERPHVVFVEDVGEPTALLEALGHSPTAYASPENKGKLSDEELTGGTEEKDILEQFPSSSKVQLVFLHGIYDNRERLADLLSDRDATWHFRPDADGILLATDEPIFCCTRSGDIPKLLTDQLISLMKKLAVCGKTRCILVGVPVTPERLQDEYVRLEKMKEYSYFCDTCEILSRNILLSKRHELDYRAAGKAFNDLFIAVISGNSVGISRIVEEMYLGLAREAFAMSGIRYLRQQLNDCYHLANDVLHNISGAVLFRSDHSLDEIEKEVDYVSASFIEMIPLSGRKKIHAKVTGAVSIVLDQFMDVESLDDVADRLGITKTYLSKVFKDDLDINFVMFLSKIRMSKAKEMMLLGVKNITDISHAVGYEDPKYFTRVFKRITGETPSQYIATLSAVSENGGDRM